MVACTNSEEYTEAEVAMTTTLTHFGERSKLYKFQVEEGLAEGLPGRVFVSGRPEMTLDVQVSRGPYSPSPSLFCLSHLDRIDQETSRREAKMMENRVGGGEKKL